MLHERWQTMVSWVRRVLETLSAMEDLAGQQAQRGWAALEIAIDGVERFQGMGCWPQQTRPYAHHEALARASYVLVKSPATVVEKEHATKWAHKLAQVCLVDEQANLVTMKTATSLLCKTSQSFGKAKTWIVSVAIGAILVLKRAPLTCLCPTDVGHCSPHSAMHQGRHERPD